jgi:LPXTG-site transpeptidase (sortase) family protein
MKTLRSIWAKYGVWILIGLPVVVIITYAAIMATATGPTPRIIAEPPTETEVTFDLERNRAFTAADGIVVIGDMSTPTAAPVTTPTISVPTDVSLASVSVPAVKIGGRYTLPEDAMMADGSIGALMIPAIRLTVNVYEAECEMEAMTHGLAHFYITSAWDGNVGLAGHNVNFDLTDGFFKNLYALKPRDTVIYTTALGSRTYAVQTIAEIAETDWSYLGRTEDNRITMITCISGKPEHRLVVQAVTI